MTATQRFTVRQLDEPRTHNPKGWMGQPGGSLITHIVWDNRHDKEFTSFGTAHAAECHADYYNTIDKNTSGFWP